MPGLLAIVDYAARPDLNVRMTAQNAASRHHDWYRQERWTAPDGRATIGRVDLGTFNPAAQPLASADGALRLCFQGEIFDLPRLCGRLKAAGASLTGTDSPDVLLATYQLEGLAGVAKLNGSYFFVLWDGDCLVVGGDRHASRSHFYSEHDGRFYLAPDVDAVIAARGDRPAPDWRGVSEFLALEYALAERTFFEGVQVFPGGTFLRVSPRGLEWLPYWSPRFSGPDEAEPRPAEAWLEEATHLYRQAVQRQTTGNFTIALSGGTDSRAIVGLAGASGYPVYTFGSENSPDVAIAQRIAGQLGLSHHVYTLREDYLAAYAEDLYRWGDGMISLFHAHDVAGLGDVARLAPVTLYGTTSEYGRLEFADNVLAEAPRSATHRVALLARHALRQRRPLVKLDGFEALLDRLEAYAWSGLTPQTAEQVLEPWLAQKMRGSVRAGLGEQLARLEAESVEDRLMTFNLICRQRRFTQWGMKVSNVAHEIRKPFEDYDLADFLLTLPAATRRKLLTRVVCHAAPDLAAIPRTGSFAPMNGSFATRALAYGRKRLRETLRPGRVQSFTDPQNALRTAGRSFYEALLLSSETLNNGLFQPDALRALVARHMRGEADEATAICALASIELWRRAHFGDNQAAKPRTA